VLPLVTQAYQDLYFETVVHEKFIAVFIAIRNYPMFP